MKVKSIFRSALALAFLILISCGDESSSPKRQFVINGQTVTLKGANIYLTGEYECCGGMEYREYFISDGEYTNGGGGNGWSIEDYTDATYLIAVQLAILSEDDFEAGEFPLYNSFADALTDLSSASYVYFESAADDNTYFECDTPSGSDHEPVVVSGGMDDGDTMTLTFNGTLEIEYYDGENWVEDEMTGKISFKGEVDDRRVL